MSKSTLVSLIVAKSGHNAHGSKRVVRSLFINHGCALGVTYSKPVGVSSSTFFKSQMHLHLSVFIFIIMVDLPSSRKELFSADKTVFTSHVSRPFPAKARLPQWQNNNLSHCNVFTFNHFVRYCTTLCKQRVCALRTCLCKHIQLSC